MPFCDRLELRGICFGDFSKYEVLGYKIWHLPHQSITFQFSNMASAKMEAATFKKMCADSYTPVWDPLLMMPMALVLLRQDEAGSGKYKMAASKLEISIYQLPEIETISTAKPIF